MKQKQFEFEVGIPAHSEQEAEAIVKALTGILSKLSEKELTALAYILKHDPVKTAIAKRYLKV